MKLYKKVAALVAAAMIVTSVPVVTMGASTNSLVYDVMKVKENHKFETTTGANALQVVFKDNTSSSETFYLELTNAEWTAATLEQAFGAPVGGVYTKTTNGVTVTYDLQGSTKSNTVKVKVTGLSSANKNEAVSLPLTAEVKTGDVSVKMLSKGGDTTITSGETFVFATTSEKVATATVGKEEDAPTIYKSGKLGEIHIDENYNHAFQKQNEYEYIVEFDNTDYELVSADIELKYGFAGATKTLVSDFSASVADNVIEYKITKLDNAFKVSLKFGDITSRDSYGKIIIKDIEVRTSQKTPEEGAFKVDIKGDSLTSTLTDVVLGYVTNYSNFIEMSKDSVKEIVAGRTAELEFTVGEKVKDSIATNREFTISVDNSEFDYQTLISKYGTDAAACKAILENTSLTAKEKEKQIKKLSPVLNLAQLKSAGIITDENTVIERIEFEKDSDGNIIPSTLVLKTASSIGTVKERSEMKFKVPVYVSIANKDKETISITTAGRALEKEVKQEATKIVNPLKVDAEPFVVKVGLQNQVGGKITLTETQAEMLQRGEIQIKVKDDNSNKVGISFTADAKLEAKGGIKGTKIETDKANKMVTISLSRTSKEAAELIISDFTVTVDRTVPEGSYDLEITGSAIDARGEALVIEDFLVVGTTNTEDLIGANGLAKGTSTFVIGENKYTVNGTVKEMDAKSYIQAPGYTMVPVRYVAEAFGVTGNNVMFANGSATFFAGNRTIQLTNNSNIAVVNGVQIKMATKVVITNGRTYAPIGEIAQLLGISKEWNSETKTATFINK